MLRVDFTQTAEAAKGPEWRDLPFGVRLQLLPPTGLVSASIEAQISRELAKFNAGQDVLSDYGFNSDEAGLLADEDIALGFAGLITAVINAANLVVDWNLADLAGEKLPIDRRSLTGLFHQGPVPGSGAAIMAAFNYYLRAPRAALAAEKNGSSSSLSGVSAVEENIAPDADRKGSPVPSEGGSKVGSAPKSSKRPRPKRASQP